MIVVYLALVFVIIATIAILRFGEGWRNTYTELKYKSFTLDSESVYTFVKESLNQCISETKEYNPQNPKMWNCSILIDYSTYGYKLRNSDRELYFEIRPTSSEINFSTTGRETDKINFVYKAEDIAELITLAQVARDNCSTYGDKQRVYKSQLKLKQELSKKRKS
jgi:hypothetical protein